MSLSDALILLPVVLFAGAIRGLSGFAGPLIMVPALSFVYDPISVIATTSLVDLSCNIALLRDAVRQCSLPTVLKIVGGATFLLPVGAYVLLTFDSRIVSRVIYSVVMLLAVVLLVGWRYRHAPSTSTLVGIGAANGFILGATSFGVAMLPFLYAGTQPTTESRANFILWAFFCGLAGFTIVALGGRVESTELLRAAILAPCYVIGAFFGNMYAKRIDSMRLRRIVLGLLVIISFAGLGTH